jgi:dethiobiotin synthetase
LTGPIVVTGTDTGVGKTVVTAAIAAAATAAGLKVAVVKPTQTGVGTGETPDVEVVVRLAKPALVRTFTAYQDSLAPMAAARVTGEAPLRAMDTHLWVRRLGRDHDLLLIEGAGGLLSPLGEGGWTAADMAVGLRAPVVVVIRAGYGTLNHTALTLEATTRRSLQTHVVIGSWPMNPELVHRTNLHDLPGDLAGAVPEGAGALAPDLFAARAAEWLSPTLHGRFDAMLFRSRAK